MDREVRLGRAKVILILSIIVVVIINIIMLSQPTIGTYRMSKKVNVDDLKYFNEMGFYSYPELYMLDKDFEGTIDKSQVTQDLAVKVEFKKGTVRVVTYIPNINKGFDTYFDSGVSGVVDHYNLKKDLIVLITKTVNFNGYTLNAENIEEIEGNYGFVPSDEMTVKYILERRSVFKLVDENGNKYSSFWAWTLQILFLLAYMILVYETVKVSKAKALEMKKHRDSLNKQIEEEKAIEEKTEE